MTPLWMDLIVRALVLAGVVGLIGIFRAIGWKELIGVADFRIERAEQADPDDEDDDYPDDTAAWDRGHDQWIDAQAGVL